MSDAVHLSTRYLAARFASQWVQGEARRLRSASVEAQLRSRAAQRTARDVRIDAHRTVEEGQLARACGTPEQQA